MFVENPPDISRFQLPILESRTRHDAWCMTFALVLDVKHTSDKRRWWLWWLDYAWTSTTVWMIYRHCDDRGWLHADKNLARKEYVNRLDNRTGSYTTVNRLWMRDSNHCDRCKQQSVIELLHGVHQLKWWSMVSGQWVCIRVSYALNGYRTSYWVRTHIVIPIGGSAIARNHQFCSGEVIELYASL